MCSTEGVSKMSYSYQTYNYPSQQMAYYNEPVQNRNNTGGGLMGAVIGGTGIGAVTSAGMAAFQNPYVNKKGEVNDMFVKRVYEKTMENASEETKNLYKQRKNVLKKIDGVNSAEKLKDLLKDNDAVFKDMTNFNQNTKESYLNGITEGNFKEAKMEIKGRIEADETFNLKSMKRNVTSCWDKNTKKFVKADGIEDHIFKNIEASKSGMKLKNIGKSALKGAGIGFGVALVLGGILKFLQNRNRQA